MYVEIAWSGDPNKSNDGRVISELRGCSSDEGDGTKQPSTFSEYSRRAYALAPKQRIPSLPIFVKKRSR